MPEENVDKAMYTDELRRARGLADLMSKQYFIQGAYPGEELKVSDIETLLLKEDRVVVYIAYHMNGPFPRVVKPNQSINLRRCQEKSGMQFLNVLKLRILITCLSLWLI